MNDSLCFLASLKPFKGNKQQKTEHHFPWSREQTMVNSLGTHNTTHLTIGTKSLDESQFSFRRKHRLGVLKRDTFMAFAFIKQSRAKEIVKNVTFKWTIYPSDSCPVRAVWRKHYMYQIWNLMLLTFTCTVSAAGSSRIMFIDVSNTPRWKCSE